MRQLVAVMAGLLVLTGTALATIPPYELELTSEFTADESSVEAHFEPLLKHKKPSMRNELSRYLERRHVRNFNYYAGLIDRQPATKEEKAILAGMLPVESGGNANAVSCKGAVGPWQVMPAWKRILRIKGSLKNPEVNVWAALRVYRIHLGDARGKKDRALVLYSGGARGYVSKIQVAKNTILQ